LLPLLPLSPLLPLLPLLHWTAMVMLCVPQNARNVLVSSCAAEACGVQGKLADLGLSRTIRQQQTHRTTNTVSNAGQGPALL
jgi:hypothetical protein